MNVQIRGLDEPGDAADIDALAAHFYRHRLESGVGDDWHFMPFEPGASDGPRGPDPAVISRTLDQPGWQRWWVGADDGLVVGHVNLKGESLVTASHRCELGIGIERGYRGRGLGRALMVRALEFARREPALVWVDLKVFAHNLPARALYQTLGFEEVGVVADRFRIAGDSVDDVVMTLRVDGPGR